MKKDADQVGYYNEFGDLYRKAILSANAPCTWTTDPDSASTINQDMHTRIKAQQDIVLKYFDTSLPVLDLGCGFGRQSFMMARNGFIITGVDSSDVFIDIAKELFEKHNLSGTFLTASVLNFNDNKRYGQVTLFDVVEHFAPDEKKSFVAHLSKDICAPAATVVVTVPYVSETSAKDRLTNIYKWLTSHFPSISAKKEHPYPLPYKSTLARLFAPYFRLEQYFHSHDTAFFVFKRI